MAQITPNPLFGLVWDIWEAVCAISNPSQTSTKLDTPNRGRPDRPLALRLGGFLKSCLSLFILAVSGSVLVNANISFSLGLESILGARRGTCCLVQPLCLHHGVRACPPMKLTKRGIARLPQRRSDALCLKGGRVCAWGFP